MVKCVLISEEEHHYTEIETHLGSDLYTILKGTATFVGQWPEIDVVILKCEKSPFDLMENRNTLPEPFNNEVIHGPILLVRMDENSEPQDFTLGEFLGYATLNPLRRPRN
jgi:hypothetical protein